MTVKYYRSDEKESLKDILKKNLGKTAKLELEREAEDSDFAAKECLIVDIDAVSYTHLDCTRDMTM